MTAPQRVEFTREIEWGIRDLGGAEDRTVMLRANEASARTALEPGDEVVCREVFTYHGDWEPAPVATQRACAVCRATGCGGGCEQEEMRAAADPADLEDYDPEPNR